MSVRRTAPTRLAVRRPVFRSVVTKNILLFLAILLVAVVPLAARYYQDSRDYEIGNLAARLEFFAERGASWLDVDEVDELRQPEDRDTPAYHSVLATLQRIEAEFGVDNAVLMRREADGRYTYIAAGHDGFEIGQPVDIHERFPATYTATNDTWLAGEMMHSQLFGGRVEGIEYDQFLQINMPLTRDAEVIAILMLNKFANPVAAAVRMKTAKVVALSVGVVAVGLALFGLVSTRMLRPLKALTTAAGEVSAGNLAIALPAPRSRDEIGRLAHAFRGMVDGLRQRDFIRDTFGRYVTREVVDELLGSPDGLRLGGEARVVTILVTDLRGFTALAATLGPRGVLEVLNAYLERMVTIIQRHRGTIDEIQGDGILAFFGAPLAAADDPLRAVACALEMQIALETFNVDQRARGLPAVGMGVGINTGEVIVGNIGSEQRTKYGAVGSAINLAYRIESYTVAGQILVSPETWARVAQAARARGTITAEFKGLERPLTLYDVCALDGEAGLFLPERAPEVVSAVEPPVAVACFPIEGKTLSPEAVPGTLVALGTSMAELALAAPRAAHTNMKVVLEPSGCAAELYAKVLAPLPPAVAGVTRIAFTSVSEPAQRRLDILRQPPPASTTATIATGGRA